MSGSGMISRRRPVRMPVGWDPDCGCETAVEAERTASVEHVRRKIAHVRALQGKGRLTATQADWMVRVLDELAVDVERGLHVQ